VNHDREDAYWREAHRNEPYFDQYEPVFRNDWESTKGQSRLGWDEASHAARAGWHRIERALPGDADGDGR
jgi:hypothetical protein